MLNAILQVLVEGIRALLSDFLPWQTVYKYFSPSGRFRHLTGAKTIPGNSFMTNCGIGIASNKVTRRVLLMR